MVVYGGYRVERKSTVFRTLGPENPESQCVRFMQGRLPINGMLQVSSDYADAYVPGIFFPDHKGGNENKWRKYINAIGNGPCIDHA